VVCVGSGLGMGGVMGRGRGTRGGTIQGPIVRGFSGWGLVAGLVFHVGRGEGEGLGVALATPAGTQHGGPHHGAGAGSASSSAAASLPGGRWASRVPPWSGVTVPGGRVAGATPAA